MNHSLFLLGACFRETFRAPDNVHIIIPISYISSPNSMFDHLLESSQRDDSNKWPNIKFREEIRQVESIEFHFTHRIWSSGFIGHPIISQRMCHELSL